MKSELLNEVREISKEFFKLPLEEKQKYSPKSGGLEGYGNGNPPRQGTFNWNDKLHLQVYPHHRRQLTIWPEKPQNFRWNTKEHITIELCIYDYYNDHDNNECVFYVIMLRYSLLYNMYIDIDFHKNDMYYINNDMNFISFTSKTLCNATYKCRLNNRFINKNRPGICTQKIRSKYEVKSGYCASHH